MKLELLQASSGAQRCQRAGYSTQARRRTQGEALTDPEVRHLLEIPMPCSILLHPSIRHHKGSRGGFATGTNNITEDVLGVSSVSSGNHHQNV